MAIDRIPQVGERIRYDSTERFKNSVPFIATVIEKTNPLIKDSEEIISFRTDDGAEDSVIAKHPDGFNVHLTILPVG